MNSPNLNDVEPGVAFQGHFAALRNAHQFMLDAEALARIGSFGHASALCLLGLEEVGKSFLYLFRAMGELNPDGPGGSGVHRSHILKHKMSAIIQSGFEQMGDIFEEFEALLEDAPEELEEAEGFMRNLDFRMYQRLEERFGDKKLDNGPILEAKVREPEKHRGLYVEVGPGERVWTPMDVTEQEFISSHQKLRSLLSMLPMVNEVPDRGDLEEWLSLMKDWCVDQKSVRKKGDS